MKRIIWHWTVSGYNVNSSSLKAYHYIIDGDGRVVPGSFPVSANAPGSSMASGTYAAHTKGLNTGSIGNSVASMLGAKESPFTTGPYPMKEVQIESLLNLTASQVKQYNIEVSGKTVLSHAEVEPTLGIKQAGKWDYMWLPGMSFPQNSVVVGNILRERLSKILGSYKPGLELTARPTIRRGSRGPDVFALQTALNIGADSVFGPATENAVKAFQKSKQLLPDGIVGPMTWEALGV